jgi:hypothetical protein
MYVRGLRSRIPSNIRARASKAGFRDPDWYAGPLRDAGPDEEENSSFEALETSGVAELERELDQRLCLSSTGRQMSESRSKRPDSWLAWIRHPFGIKPTSTR